MNTHTTPTEVCATCRYALAASETQAICRRHPPTAHILMVKQQNVLTAQQGSAPQAISVMVTVQPDGWCGEWAAAAPALALAS